MPCRTFKSANCPVALSLAIFSLADGILRCERLRQCQPLPRSPRAFHLAV
jgi:hypothetical protein